VDTKKVNAVALPYLAFDGSTQTGLFMAEFNDASFSGNISALEGTFSGKLTADAVNAAANINIAGQSVARTTISVLADRRGFSDGDGWASVHSVNFVVPNSDEQGGWFTCGIQYAITDEKWDNDNYRLQYRIVINGVALYNSPWLVFGDFYRMIKDLYHEVSGVVTTPGVKNIDLQYQFAEQPTNVYPVFTNTTFRVDYIRK